MILHEEYKIEPHSSLWFSSTCAVVRTNRNQFFHFYQQNKPALAKTNFSANSDILVIIGKYFSNQPNVPMTNKDVYRLPETYFCDFKRAAISVFDKQISS